MHPGTHALLSLTCCLIAVLGGMLFSSDSHALSQGDKIVLKNEDGLNVRSDHRISQPRDANVIATVPTGTKGVILSGPVKGPTYTWYKIEWETSVTGWSVETINGCKTIITTERARKKDKIVAKLFNFNLSEVDTKTNHDYNDYGCLPHNNPKRCNGYYGGHAGWDVQTTPEADSDRNAEFCALTAGELILAGGNFNTIAVYNRTDDKTTLYLHASEVLVSVEDNPTVEMGQPLGKQGQKGNATGPHVHIEVRVGKTIYASCGITGSKQAKHPNEDPISYLFQSVNDDNNTKEKDKSKPSPATVSITPSSVRSPAVGEQLTLSLKIADGENVAGYQATVEFDTSALRYVESAKGDYLKADAFFVPPVDKGNRVTLASSAIASVSNGDGTLATITFEVIAIKTSMVALSQVFLVDPDGALSYPQTENGEVTEIPQLVGDVNKDGIVNIQDLVLVGANFGKTGENIADVNSDGVVNIIDLVKVAGAFGNTAAPPAQHPHALAILTATDVQGWLTQARHLDLTDATVQRGIIVLKQLLAVLTPKETALLPNYPNPFNPETWIPYHLAHASDVTLTIYNTKGAIVRRFELGHQPAGYYTARAKARYWNGRNASGELVASGIYFYQLRAGDYSALRRMVIVK